jgi:hypothetical protein
LLRHFFPGDAQAGNQNVAEFFAQGTREVLFQRQNVVQVHRLTRDELVVAQCVNFVVAGQDSHVRFRLLKKILFQNFVHGNFLVCTFVFVVFRLQTKRARVVQKKIAHDHPDFSEGIFAVVRRVDWLSTHDALFGVVFVFLFDFFDFAVEFLFDFFVLFFELVFHFGEERFFFVVFFGFHFIVFVFFFVVVVCDEVFEVFQIGKRRFVFDESVFDVRNDFVDVVIIIIVDVVEGGVGKQIQVAFEGAFVERDVDANELQKRVEQVEVEHFELFVGEHLLEHFDDELEVVSRAEEVQVALRFERLFERNRRVKKRVQQVHLIFLELQQVSFDFARQRRVQNVVQVHFLQNFVFDREFELLVRFDFLGDFFRFRANEVLAQNAVEILAQKTFDFRKFDEIVVFENRVDQFFLQEQIVVFSFLRHQFLQNFVLELVLLQNVARVPRQVEHRIVVSEHFQKRGENVSDLRDFELFEEVVDPAQIAVFQVLFFDDVFEEE